MRGFATLPLSGTDVGVFLQGNTALARAMADGNMELFTLLLSSPGIDVSTSARVHDHL